MPMVVVVAGTAEEGDVVAAEIVGELVKLLLILFFLYIMNIL
jgi:hypothetical protein